MSFESSGLPRPWWVGRDEGELSLKEMGSVWHFPARKEKEGGFAAREAGGLTAT